MQYHRFMICLALALAPLAGHPGLAAPPKRTPALPDDVTAVRARMQVLHDGKGHFVVHAKTDDTWQTFWYGDGKTMYAQRILGGGREGDIAFNRSFWEPRVARRFQASFDFRDGKFQIQCDERKTELTALPALEADKLLAGATFFQHHWRRQAYALARDNEGTYFYVDRGVDPQFQKNFKLFVGPRGKLKAQDMTNVVSDSEGDVFATKTGTLRLVLNKTESLWVKKGKEIKLISLPIEDNAALIYGDLGVYLGERLGTPCDDL